MSVQAGLVKMEQRAIISLTNTHAIVLLDTQEQIVRQVNTSFGHNAGFLPLCIFSKQCSNEAVICRNAGEGGRGGASAPPALC